MCTQGDLFKFLARSGPRGFSRSGAVFEMKKIVTMHNADHNFLKLSQSKSKQSILLPVVVCLLILDHDADHNTKPTVLTVNVLAVSKRNNDGPTCSGAAQRDW